LILVTQDKINDYTARGWWGTQTLDDVFRGNLALYGSRAAVADPPNRASFTDGVPRSLSYSQLDEEVMRLCSVLLADGLTKDDVIAMQMPNCVEQFVVYLACARLGIVVSPVPVQYREHELSHVLSITRARAAITCRRIGRHAHAAMFVGLQASQPALRAVYAFGATGADAARGEAMPDGVVALAPRLEATGDHANLVDYLQCTTISANDVFTICWTSGTESVPKGVPRSHNEWLVLAPSIIEGANLRAHCRMLCPFPLVNMAGLAAGFATWLLLAGTVVQHQPFDLTVFLQQLRDEKIDYTIAAPTILSQLLHNESLAEGIDFRRLATIGSGSAPLSLWLVKGFKDRFGVDIVNHFGSNEGASLTGGPRDVPDPEMRARFFPRAGVAGFDWHVSTTRKVSTRLVHPETGADIHEPGVIGELRYAGATVFSGYYNAPEMTARAFDAQGYYKTGDLFEIGGEQGQYYRYAGRSKDVVVRGGMNISSEEIENLILAHPHVCEAAVVGYADEAMGERVCACVVLKSGATLTLDALKAYLRDEQHIAVYKLPERLVLLEALPRNPVGKVLKRVLREQVGPDSEYLHST
jgi:acyl-CoA synthetase (AMP-forming)/AMP-acid ligase II